MVVVFCRRAMTITALASYVGLACWIAETGTEKGRDPWATARLVQGCLDGEEAPLWLLGSSLSCTLGAAFLLLLPGLPVMAANTVLDRAARFVVYKSTIVAFVLLPSDDLAAPAAEALCWGSLFAAVGVLRLALRLCILHYLRVESSPGATAGAYGRLVGAMLSLSALNGALAAFVVGVLRVGGALSLPALLFTLYDSVTLSIDSTYYLLRCCAALLGASPQRWHVESFALDVVHDAGHHALSAAYSCLLLWADGLGVKLVDALLLLNARAAVASLHSAAVVRTMRYARSLLRVQLALAEATDEQLAALGGESCAICRHDLDVGTKRLPCGHFYHVGCIRSWFESAPSAEGSALCCPVCRAVVPLPVRTAAWWARC